jgi:dTDP-4-amino-4,6-dideoxygalactose transaminase
VRKLVAHPIRALETSHHGMSTYTIPFNRASLVGKEAEYVSAVMAGGRISGDEAYSKKCQALLQQALGVPKALITTSCTHALEMCALLLDLEPGDEVIVPSYTFASGANAFALHGARPVFCDVRADTLNIDETRLESLITTRTRAIAPVHYAGVACEMDTILAVAKRRGIPVVEDNAHGLFGKYKGRWLGTLGSLAAQSFHETKNITCGEGGALLINDPELVEQAEIIREKGTDRSRFFRGQVDRYTWVDKGSSYVQSDILSAFLYGQLEMWEAIQRRRGEIWRTYDEELRDWSRNADIRQPVVPPDCEQAYHMYYLLLPSLHMRQRLIDALKERGILAVFHYLPLHLSNMGRKFGARPGDCPVAEDISDRLLRLPFYYSLSADEQMHVIDALLDFEP